MIGKSMFLVLMVLIFMAGHAQAQTAPDPTGIWKWTVEMNGNSFEQTLKLKLDGSALTGSLLRRDGTETPIEEGSFKDGVVTFKITRERDGQTWTITYSGKLVGDTIKGQSEFVLNGETRSRDWEAQRG